EEDGVQRRAEERRNDQRRHRRKDLEDNHVQLALPTDTRRLEEVARTQRQRLRAELARAVRPAQRAEHYDEREEPRVLLVRGDDDDQREDRNDEDHVYDQRQDAVRDPAQIRREDTDDHGERGRQSSNSERDHNRLPRAPDQLRQDVLAVRRRSEPMM